MGALEVMAGFMAIRCVGQAVTAATTPTPEPIKLNNEPIPTGKEEKGKTGGKAGQQPDQIPI